MRFTVQKRLAAQILGCSEKRIRFDQEALSEVKEAITKGDIRSMINGGLIVEKQKKGVSRFNARKIKVQKSKGRRKGSGSRKGKSTARSKPKQAWMNKVRSQRRLVKNMKERNLLDVKAYRELYLKIKGGFFRNQRHVKLYIEEKNLLRK